VILFAIVVPVVMKKWMSVTLSNALVVLLIIKGHLVKTDDNYLGIKKFQNLTEFQNL